MKMTSPPSEEQDSGQRGDLGQILFGLELATLSHPANSVSQIQLSGRGRGSCDGPQGGLEINESYISLALQ